VIVASLLTGAGAANALVARGDAHSDLDVPESPTTTHTDTGTSRSTGVEHTTVTAPTLVPSLSTTGAPPPYTTDPAPQPELVGTISPANPTFVAEQPTAVTLTIRNTTDHVWHSDVQPSVHLGVFLAPIEQAGECVDAQPSDFTIGPREQRTYSMEITPNRHMLGRATLSAVFLYDHTEGNCLMGDAPDGVPGVDATIVPPGWSPGQPLDATQGHWDARETMSTYAAHRGDTVTVSATVRNVGADDQATYGFGSLAVVCHGPLAGSDTPWQLGRLFDPAVLHPGEELSASFSVTVQPAFVGTAICTVAMAFHGDVATAEYNRYLDAPWEGFDVLDDAPTTTAPKLTPTTTSTSGASADA